MSLFAGVDLGGTHMQVGVVDADGVLRGRSRGMTDTAAGLEGVCRGIAARVGEACAGAGVSTGDLGGVGLAAPGAVDPVRGVVVNAPNIGWQGAPAAEVLGRCVGVPVHLDNDVNAAVLAEQRLGAGRGHEDVFGAWLGTGVGGGLVLGGRVHHGAAFSAGEIGHVRAAPDAAGGPVELERVASRTAIAAMIRRRIEDGQASSLSAAVRGGDRLSSTVIAEAAAAGDRVTLGVLEHAMGVLGWTIATVVTLLSVRRVVLGGGLVEEMGELLTPMVERRVQALAWPQTLSTVEVRPTELRSDAGLHGAAMIARERAAAGAGG